MGRDGGDMCANCEKELEQNGKGFWRMYITYSRMYALLSCYKYVTYKFIKALFPGSCPVVYLRSEMVCATNQNSKL